MIPREKRRHLLLQYKGATLGELKELAAIHDKAGHAVQQARFDPDKNTSDFSEYYAPATLGLIRKEIYYREGFGGTTISEKYPDIFTVRGPKNGTELKNRIRSY